MDASFRYAATMHILLYFEEHLDLADGGDGGLPDADPSFLYRSRGQASKGWSQATAPLSDGSAV